jgi:Subtilase family
LRACDSRTPLLEPEALQLTHTAFADPAVPQAQSLATGKGVTVAFFADGADPNNPDFIRSGKYGPKGQHVFVSNLDFGGDGPEAKTSGAEGFGDASSVAAQGNQTYDLNRFVNSAHQAVHSCPIKILGMAPGASLMGFSLFGQSFILESTIMLAIQYAVDHGANVLSESLGFYPTPDDNVDPMTLANDAAVARGLTVVVASGDAGSAGTVGSPASDPKIIAAGATTQFQAYEQLGFGGSPLGSGGYIDNNVSSISSGGVTQRGKKSIDVMAPGDLSWALCTPKSIWMGCQNFNGKPSSIELFGGTSEAAPLTAGEAALVIQAYRATHAGSSPSPALVKQIITSTATDLGAPGYEQGAGLIDSLRAVQAARSSPIFRVGSGLLTSPGTLFSAGEPGASFAFRFAVHNVGREPQTVEPTYLTQSAPMAATSYKLQIEPKSDATFKDEYGNPAAYVAQTFTVPGGAQRLDAAIAWGSGSPLTCAQAKCPIVNLTLFDPQGKLAAYSSPPNVDSGYGHVDVRFPTPGTWKAVIWTVREYQAYTGKVSLDVAFSRFVRAGLIKPGRVMLAPDETGDFVLNVSMPKRSGDTTGEVVFNSPAAGEAGVAAGAIPVILRALIPLHDGHGTFSGQLTGGDGVGAFGESLTYAFDVPASQRDVGISVILARRTDVAGVLVDPSGLAKDVQESIVSRSSRDNDTADRTTESHPESSYDPAATRRMVRDFSFKQSSCCSLSGAATRGRGSAPGPALNMRCCTFSSGRRYHVSSPRLP